MKPYIVCIILVFIHSITFLHAQSSASRQSSITIFEKWSRPEKGAINFQLSLPEGNHFVFKRAGNYESHAGLAGGVLGVEYFFTDQDVFLVKAGGVADLNWIYPVSYGDEKENYDRTVASFISFQMGREFKRSQLSWGTQCTYIHYTGKSTSQINNSLVLEERRQHIQTGVGGSFGYTYRVMQYFNLGVMYMPSFVAFDINHERGIRFQYSHVLFFHLIGNFRYK